jgi:hypothetical protein
MLARNLHFSDATLKYALTGTGVPEDMNMLHTFYTSLCGALMLAASLAPVVILFMDGVLI